eukprot:scaffold18116_cov126-Skeletonema_menzelii.AAC.2
MMKSSSRLQMSPIVTTYRFLRLGSSMSEQSRAYFLWDTKAVQPLVFIEPPSDKDVVFRAL